MREKDPDKISAIFDAALKLVLVEGFTALKMSSVARMAGLATGTLYIYFPGKEDLINQLYIHLKRRHAARFLAGYDSRLPFKVCFDLLWNQYLNAQLENPGAAAFMEQYYRSPYLKENVLEETEKLLAPVFELLERGKREQLLKNVSTDLMIIQLSGFISELVKWTAGSKINVDETMRMDALKLTWDSIKS